MAEQPEPEKPNLPDDAAVEPPVPSEDPPPKRIPDHDPEASESGKRFMSADDGPLKVVVDGGDVASQYAPADLIAKIAGGVSATLKAFGGGFTPMLYRVAPGHSMTLHFGDPHPLEAQATLPVEITLSQAQRVGQLIDLEGDEFFHRALLIGEPMRHYSELAQVVQSEGVKLSWEVRGEDPHVLTTARAQRHHTRLSAPPTTQDRPLIVNGVLYRVITESTREGYAGSVGIHLHEWSARPPRAKPRQRIIALYEDRDIEAEIKKGLIGEPVEALLLVRHAVPGTTIEPEKFDLVLSVIDHGDPEGELTGSMFDEDDQ